jgi:uncharacterized membrane protein
MSNTISSIFALITGIVFSVAGMIAFYVGDKTDGLLALNIAVLYYILSNLESRRK